MTGPYGEAATAYWTAGWRGILPLPPRKKKSPPPGYTGGSGGDPSYADIHTWATGPEGAGNIALRLPRHVLGIDVDSYGDKLGSLTLKGAEELHGPLPPTWRTTSRDDGVSGIRPFRIPEGLVWPGELGPGTELIQHGHRYALVWPSVHPDTGATYRWINPRGVVSTAVPDPDEFPPLPEEWVKAYTGGIMSTPTSRDHRGADEAAVWIATRPGAGVTPCTRMARVPELMRRELSGSAHNAARDGVLRAVRLAEEGHRGVVEALRVMRGLFLTDATNPDRELLRKARRTPREAEREWQDLLTSGTNLVTANPTGTSTCDCDGQITSLIIRAGLETAGSTALAPAPIVLNPTPSEEGKDRRLQDGATFILDAPTEIPSLWGEGEEVLWAEGEALMLVGPPGVGKTTVTGQIVAGLLFGRSLLGLPMRPAARRVLYLAMDRPAQIARSLRRSFCEADREVLADRLRVWVGPPPGDVARNPEILLSLAVLAEADVLIVDSLKDAAIGLTEDEVGGGYNRARQTALTSGVQILELHHLVKRGPNGAKPTQLADVYGSAWLTAGAGSVVLLWGSAGDLVVEMTHLKQPAAEVGPWRLLHNHVTGTTTVMHGADVLMMVAATGGTGMTVKGLAVALSEKPDPSRNDIEKARRSLDRLVEQGFLAREEGRRGGNSESRNPAVYRLPSDHETKHGIHGPLHGQSHGYHADDKTPGQTVTDPITPNTATNHAGTPSIEGGVPGVGAPVIARCPCGARVRNSYAQANGGRCPRCSVGGGTEL